MKCWEILDPKQLLEHLCTRPHPSSSMRSPIHLEPTSFNKDTNQLTHLKMWINLISMFPSAPLPIRMEHVHLIPHVTSCFIWILPAIHLIHKTSQVLKMLKLNFFLNLKYNWTIPTFHQQMFSLGSMIMICSYSTNRLILHLTI